MSWFDAPDFGGRSSLVCLAHQNQTTKAVPWSFGAPTFTNYANLFVGYVEEQIFNQFDGPKPELFGFLTLFVYANVLYHCIMSCHVMSCHIMSCHVMSCHVISCHVMSCYVMLCYVMSCHIT